MPACVLTAARLDQNLHLSLLLDYCDHREPKDLKDTKTATLRTLFFDILPRGSQSRGLDHLPEKTVQMAGSKSPVGTTAFLTSVLLLFIGFFVCLFKILLYQRLVSVCILHYSVLLCFENFPRHLK